MVHLYIYKLKLYISERKRPNGEANQKNKMITLAAGQKQVSNSSWEPLKCLLKYKKM